MTADPTPELARWWTVARQYLMEIPEMPRTPGPWTVRDADLIVGPFGNVVAECFGYSDKATDDAQRAQGGRESNSRLIAAAPDLLEACELAAEWAKDAPAPYRDWPFIRAARAAIAKAKGE